MADEAKPKQEMDEATKEKIRLKKEEQARKKAEKAAKAEQAEKSKASGGAATVGNKEGMDVKKAEDFAEWYHQVLIKAELVDFYTVSGCYIYRPGSYFIWEQIQEFFNVEIRKLGVQNVYFPMFVTKKALETEESHVDGFAAEVAWVTRSGSGELAEPIAIRPTSETVMYPSYSKWIRSHRDLPLQLNQWSNVVRWEFKNPTPFIRTREFLWQEGHTAFATQAEADVEVLAILRLYKRIYEELLAVPVVEGRKSEKERFAGALYTTTVEGFVSANGRAVQAATSHHLGQNFSKMFNIEFENEDGGKSFAWQNSWGLSTRSIGLMIMVHGDDKGMVYPPRVAATQVVIVPIVMKDKDRESLNTKSAELCSLLKAAGIRATVDARDNYNPGWKYNHWELKGIPIRMELGPRDLQNEQVVCVRRDTSAKCTASWGTLAQEVGSLLESIQADMFGRAKADMDAHSVFVSEWKDFLPALDGGNKVLVPWCNRVACEEHVKKQSGLECGAGADAENSKVLTGAAKTLCIPLEQDAVPAGTKCFACEEMATVHCFFGRSY